MIHPLLEHIWDSESEDTVRRQTWWVKMESNLYLHLRAIYTFLKFSSDQKNAIIKWVDILITELAPLLNIVPSCKSLPAPTAGIGRPIQEITWRSSRVKEPDCVISFVVYGNV